MRQQGGVIMTLPPMARQIKGLAPATKILFYKNSILDWSDYGFHDKLLRRPDIWARQADGNATRTHGDKEFVQPKEGMLSVDFAKAAGRAFWMSECRTPDFDGCFS